MLLYEKKSEQLLPMEQFLLRQLKHAGVAFVIVGGSLGIGILGYHFTEHLSWLDSLLNASMILGGMGPVDAVKTDAGKLFASFYALFSGMVFLAAAGVLFAPLFHRFIHRFHLDLDESDSQNPGPDQQTSSALREKHDRSNEAE